MAVESRRSLGWSAWLSRGLIAVVLGAAGAGVATYTLEVLQRPPHHCSGAEQVELDGKPTGFARCESGAVVRQEAVECPSLLPRLRRFDSRHDRRVQKQLDDAGRVNERIPNAKLMIRDTLKDACKSDHDCVGELHGHCEESLPSGPNICLSGCVRDSECAPDEICFCGEPVGECVKASCKSDADCPHSSCAMYTTSPGCGGEGFACLKDEDECSGDADCDGCRCAYDSAREVRVCVCGSCKI